MKDPEILPLTKEYLSHKETKDKLVDCLVEINKLELQNEKAIDLLVECRLQLRYLEQRFGETGSGNNVLSRVNTFLESVNE
jgi:hypothetical protein